MTKGIYLFWDKKYEQIIYAGRFTGIKRIKDHFQPSKKHAQKINEYIQEYEDRIEPIIFCEFDDISDNDLNQLEKETIKLFRLNKYKYPDNFVFNFTDGGGGMSGHIVSEENRKKISKSHKGKKHTPETCKKISESKKGKNHPMWGKKHTPETLKKMSEAKKGKKNYMFGKKHTLESRKKMSENMPDLSGKNSSNWKDYPRIVLGGIINGKQRYVIKYNGKIFATSVYKKKLYEKWYSKYPDIKLINETI